MKASDNYLGSNFDAFGEDEHGTCNVHISQILGKECQLPLFFSNKR